MAISDEDLAKARKISVEQVRLLRETRGATAETLEKLSEPALLRAIRRLNYSDLPRARAAFRVRQSRNDDGSIPTNALGKALGDLRSLRAKMPKTRMVQAGLPVARSVSPPALIALPAVAGLAPSAWQWLGPGNIGGRTRAIVVHPTDPQRIWIGSAGGGIWHTQDGGLQWAPVDDFMANLAVTCLAMNSKTPLILYAGTGEGFDNLDAIRGAGIFRSIDGGATWQQLTGTTNDNFRAVNRIAVSRSGTVVLAATNTGLFRSTDKVRKTWTQVAVGEFADVKFHPTSSTKAIAGGLGDGRGLYSTNGGATWKVASHDPWSGRVELCYARRNPNVVYASVQMTHGEIWRSSDGGKTYQRRNSLTTLGGAANYLGDQGWYDNAIWADDPTDENFVIVGGIDLWRSDDGGNTLREISTWWHPDSAHADHHAIVSHPGYDGQSQRTVFFGNDGGIYKATDVRALGAEAQPPYTSGWTRLVNSYGVTQFYGGAVNANSGKIVGGAQDNGTLCFDPAAGPQAWRTIFGGDGGWCAADPTDQHVFYGEYVFLNIHRNTDGGTTDDTAGDRYISGQFWDPTVNDWRWKPLPFRIPDAQSNNALFIAPFVLDPNNPNRLLAGGRSLWLTVDAKTPNTFTSGPSWRAIKLSAGSLISALAVARGNSDIIWVGHVDGQIYRTANGTASQPVWPRVDHVGSSPLDASRYCTCITIAPSDPNEVYVAFGGYVHGNVWATRDGGTTWTNLGGALPAAPIRAIAVHPRRPELVYVGTEVGIFGSEDRGATWSPTNEGPTNCSVDDLFWKGETLICATHGRGMFLIDLSGV